MTSPEASASAEEAMRRSGVWRGLAVGSLRLASVFYGLGARTHRAWMRWTSADRGRLACAVVSVGGLTVGGAGKTPVAARLALGLRRRGWRVVLASRGYRGRDRSSVVVVSDGAHVHSSVARSGDESFVLAAHAPGVPVLVGRDRRVVGHHAVSAFDAEILVLDDGFQHHRLARDLDIVCIDGGSGLGSQRLLPAGPLREPVSTLRHADWLCIVDGERPEGVVAARKTIERERDAEVVSAFERSGGEMLRARRRPVDLATLDADETRSLDALRDQRVGLLAGIARPDSFRRTLQDLGARVVVERRFRDHHDYAPRDCAGLGDASILWVTTEKDALKILPEWLDGARLWVLRIEVAIDGEEGVLDRLEEKLRAAGRLPDRPGGKPEAEGEASWPVLSADGRR